MSHLRIFLQLLCLSTFVIASSSEPAERRRPAKRHYDTHDYYVLDYDSAAGIPVEACADALGVELVEPAGELPDHWLARTQKQEALLLEGSPDPVLVKLEHIRRLPGSSTSERSETSTAMHVASAIRRVHLQTPRRRSKRYAVPTRRAPPPVIVPNAPSSARAVAERLGIIDPLFPDQWHLVNDEFPEHMMNATPVWEMGITGEGVISALVDDGLQYDSDDLSDNFDAEGSYDFNDHVDLPKPMLWDDHHGTRCAGQIAAVKNNACGVGIAYNSKVAGLRILSGPISDVDEAAALNYGYQNTSIYSCSWGPPDDGRSMEGPNYLIEKAIVNGVQNGRHGKGSIFVFASGNGASSGDQCNFDGYVNSIYTLTVAAVDYMGKHSRYSESCAANMVVAYTSGSNRDKSIVTTDMGQHACTTEHGGTSAAAPNAVGVVALALSVRPDLTWRDVQHLAVQTAQIVSPDDEGWELTAAGRPYNYKFGFGKIDAYQFVSTAINWQLVKPQAWVDISASQLANGTMTSAGEMQGGELIVSKGVNHSVTITQQILDDNNFEDLEHVTVRVWISHEVRGDVEVELISPAGIRSMLARSRPADGDRNGFPGWQFMTVKHWAESALGEWTIRVSDQNVTGRVGHFLGWSMSLWGSAIDPIKAKQYVLPYMDDVPFPAEPTHIIPPPEATFGQASTTKSYEKPTVSATPLTSTSTGSVNSMLAPTLTPSPTDQEDAALPDESAIADDTTMDNDDGWDWEWVTDGAEYVSNRQFTFGSAAAILLTCLILVILFIRRRRASRLSGEYVPVSNQEEMRMGLMSSGDRPSFGQRVPINHVHVEGGAAAPYNTESAGLVFHSEFLDDDDPGLALTPEPLYQDLPDENVHARQTQPFGDPS